MVTQGLPTSSFILGVVGMQFRIYIPVVLGNLLLKTTFVEIKKGRPFPRIVGARWYLFMSYPEALRTNHLGLHLWVMVTFGDYFVDCWSGFFSLGWEIRSYFIQHNGVLFLRIPLLVGYGAVCNNINNSCSDTEKHIIHRVRYPLFFHQNLSLVLFVAFPQPPLPILKRVRFLHESMDTILTALFRVLCSDLDCFTLRVGNTHPCDRNTHPRDCIRHLRGRNSFPHDCNRHPRVRNRHPPDPGLVTSVMVFHRGLFSTIFISFTSSCSSIIVQLSSQMVFNSWRTFCRNINSGLQLKFVLSLYLNLFPVTLIKTLHPFCVTDGPSGDLDAENSTMVELLQQSRYPSLILGSASPRVSFAIHLWCHLSLLGLSPWFFDSLNGFQMINSQAAALELMVDSQASLSRVLCLDFRFTSLQQITRLGTMPVVYPNFTYWLTTGKLDLQTYRVIWMVFLVWKIFGKGFGMLLLSASYISFIFLLAFRLDNYIRKITMHAFRLASFLCIIGCVLCQLMKFKGLTWIGFKPMKLEQDEEDEWFHYYGVIPFCLKGYITSGHFCKWPVAVNLVCMATQCFGFVIIRLSTSWTRSNLSHSTVLSTPMITRSITTFVEVLSFKKKIKGGAGFGFGEKVTARERLDG